MKMLVAAIALSALFGAMNAENAAHGTAAPHISTGAFFR